MRPDYFETRAEGKRFRTVLGRAALAMWTSSSDGSSGLKCRKSRVRLDDDSRREQAAVNGA